MATASPAAIPTHQARVDTVWKTAIWLTAFLPFIQAIVTWDYDGRMEGMWFALRHYSFPAIIGEIAIIMIAIRSGMLPSTYMKSLSKTAMAALLLWAIFALFSSLFIADNRAVSMMTLIRFALHGLFLAALIHMVRQARLFSPIQWLLAIMAGILAYIAVLTLFALTIPDPANFPWMQRLPSATNIRQIANIIAIPAIAPFALLFFSNGKHKWSYAAAIFALTLFIAWSGSRGALFGMVTGTIGALILMRRIPAYSSIAAATASFFCALLASLALSLPTGSFGLFRFANKAQDITSGRVEIWINTITEIGKSPWTGHGAGSFNVNMHALHGIDFNHPHNFILQFAYDWGIVGGAAILLLLALFGLTIVRSAAKAPLTGFAALAGFLTLLTISMVDGALFYPLTIMMVLAMVAPVFISNLHQDTK
ncbi:MAG: O-antigen ligase family protein [Sphingomonadales bacterium]|nr:O-antigen ligase family protein [Sphingomonadales bacterium]